MENQYEKKWYDNIALVVILCFCLWPLGLFALWKNREISQNWKIGVTVLIVGLFIGTLLTGDRGSFANANLTFEEQIVRDAKELYGSGICEDIPAGAIIKNVKVGEITPLEGMGIIDVSLEFDYEDFGLTQHKVDAMLYSKSGSQYNLEAIGGCDYPKK